MTNFIHYYEYALGIDIDKLGKAYFDIRKHLSYNTDDKSKIDFNAICVNRKPGDEDSITGGNIRGLYWTKPDTTNHEEQRLEPVDEAAYTEICPEFKDTYFEEALSGHFSAPVCRARLHFLAPGMSLQPHIDYDPSYGVRIVCPISGTDECINQFWVNGEYKEYNLPADGRVWFLNTGFKHGVVNNGTEPRIALLATLKSQEDIECLKLVS